HFFGNKLHQYSIFPIPLLSENDFQSMKWVLDNEFLLLEYPIRLKGQFHHLENDPLIEIWNNHALFVDDLKTNEHHSILENIHHCQIVPNLQIQLVYPKSYHSKLNSI